MLTRNISIAACALMLIILSDTAVAQSGFYVFGAVGDTSSDISNGVQSAVHDDSNSFKIGAGYAVNPNISIEAAYQDVGSQSAATDCPPGFACVALVVPLVTQADLRAWSISAIGSISLTEKLDVFGKVGVSDWDLEFDGISAAFDTSDQDLLYGAGLRWSISDHWRASLEYENVELGIDTVGIVASYYF